MVADATVTAIPSATIQTDGPADWCLTTMARLGANICVACLLLFARFSITRPELQSSRHRGSGARHGGWGGSRTSKKHYTPMLRISVDAPDPEEDKALQELLSNTTELRERIARLVFTQELGDALTLVYQAVDR